MHLENPAAPFKKGKALVEGFGSVSFYLADSPFRGTFDFASFGPEYVKIKKK